jgi:hypothetical protein
MTSPITPISISNTNSDRNIIALCTNASVEDQAEDQLAPAFLVTKGLYRIFFSYLDDLHLSMFAAYPKINLWADFSRIHYYMCVREEFCCRELRGVGMFADKQISLVRKILLHQKEQVFSSLEDADLSRLIHETKQLCNKLPTEPVIAEDITPSDLLVALENELVSPIRAKNRKASFVARQIRNKGLLPLPVEPLTPVLKSMSIEALN